MLKMSKDDLITAIDENLENVLPGCRAIVRLAGPKRKTLGEKGIDCILVGYAEHSKAYRPKDVIPNSVESQRDNHSDDVPSEIPKPRKEAIDDEIGSIMENNTWVLSDLPPGCKPLGCKWIFKRKMKVDGTIDKFKARLVIQGFRQKEGIDYFDNYAPVARITTIRLLLALAAIHNLVIHQMDVKTKFLNGDLDEEVYMKQPEGFIMPGNEHKVCKLVKSLYGLKEAPKSGIKSLMRFSMKEKGEADVILGIKIKRKNKGIVITQPHYIEKILKKFNREDCYLVSTPMDLVEKLKPNTGYSDASWINHIEDSSSMSEWMFLLGGGAISWVSKKQTCITGSTMKSKFIALAATSKEAECLRNLIHEILIWPKPIAPISIHCDSASTLAKAYSQMYNGKSRHLADHLTKGLSRDLVNNKSNITLKWEEGGFVGDFSVIDGHLGNDDLLETNDVSCSARIRVREAWSAHSLS
nr:zinc finger, CCHC-type [Tanacetum cinerariifolium]